MLDWPLGFTMAEGECEEFWQRTARDLESGDLFWDEEEEIYFWDEELEDVELDGGQVEPFVLLRRMVETLVVTFGGMGSWRSVGC